MIQLPIKNTRGYGAAMGVKILVYGRAGRGKTRLISTCPRPFVLTAESGLLSLAGYDIPYYEINTMADLTNAYQWARSSAEARQFDTLCVDSVSEVAEKCLLSAQAKNKDGRMAYGDMIKDMNKVIKDFRDLPGKHVYMTAKQERVTSPEGVSMFGPMMPGKQLGQAMPYFPDEVFQADIHPTDGYYFLRCKPDFASDAKDRSGALDAMEKPDIGNIINKILAAGRQQGQLQQPQQV